MQRFDTLVTNEPARVLDACEDVFALKPRVPFQDGRDVISGGEHAEHVLDSQAPTANDRLPAEDGGVHDDSGEKVGVSHAFSVRASSRDDKDGAAIRAAFAWI